MARLELPVRAFIEDFVRQAFPGLDWSRGSAINDLVIKAHATLIQPLRHEIDAIKINSSISNYAFMSREDLDALAANWGKFRQRGSRSFGNVRLYFDRAAEYRLSYLEFQAVDGTIFVLSGPVVILEEELLANRQSDGTFAADVPVQSLGVGSRYSLSRGDITAVRNGPTSLIRVENLEDFQTTSPDESNLDVVNSLFRNIGLRNLVSRQSIRTPIFDNFPGVLDIFIATADHPQMMRDLIEVRIGNADVTLHLGGVADIWCNTNALSRRSLTLSYLPTSQRISIVSARQAEEDTLLYAFSSVLMSLEGEYAAPNFPDVVLDESTGIFVDQRGIPMNAFVIDIQRGRRYTLSSRDLISGRDLLALPITGLVSDLIDVNWANTTLETGDMIRIGDKYHQIAELGGRVARLSPPTERGTSLTFDIDGSVNPGALRLPSEGAAGEVRLMDRVVIAEGAGAGYYTVRGTDGNDVLIGNVLAEGELTRGTQDEANQGSHFYTWRALGDEDPRVPFEVPNTAWAYWGPDLAGLDPDPVYWARVNSIVRTSSGLSISLETSEDHAQESAVLIQGLRGQIEEGSVLVVDRDGPARYQTPVRQGDDPATRYANILTEDLTVSSTTIRAPGVGAASSPGDVILFDVGTPVPEEVSHFNGGGGERFSLFVDASLGADEVRFAPSVSFTIAAGTRYAVMRNGRESDRLMFTSAVEATRGERSVRITDVPLGVGDMLGMGIKHAANIDLADVTLTEVEEHPQGSIFHLSATTATPISNFAEWAQEGDILTIDSEPAYDGPHRITKILTVSTNTSPAWVTVQVQTPELPVDDGLGGTVALGAERVYAIQSTTAGPVRQLFFEPPRIAVPLTMDSSEYSTLNEGNIGAAVTQDTGSGIVHGIIESFSNSNYLWVIIPNDPTQDIFVSGEEVVLANGFQKATVANVGGEEGVRYFEPESSDLGRIVRQGTFRGVLESYTTAPADTRYRWTVKPFSEFDRFDSTVDVVFVDRGEGEPTPQAAQGRLRRAATEAALSPVSNVTVNVDKPVLFEDEDQIDIHSRFGRSGGLFQGGRFRLLDDLSVSGEPLTSTSTDDRLAILLGDNIDYHQIQSLDTHRVDVSGNPLTEVIPLTNGPGRFRMELTAPVMSGATTLTVPGSGMGFWAHRGRVLLLQQSGGTWHLISDGPEDADTVTLRDPLPLTLYPDNNPTLEVVDGFVTPWWTVDPGQAPRYRTFRRPEVDEVVFEGAGGAYVTGQNAFFSASVDFVEVLGWNDFDTKASELLLYIDTGPAASTEGYRILSASGGGLTIDAGDGWPGSATRVQFHIGRRNRAEYYERWVPAVVLGETTLQLLTPEDWDPRLFGGVRRWTATIDTAWEPAQSVLDFQALPRFALASFDPDFQLLELDIAATEGSNVTDLYTDGVGLDQARVGERVYLHLRHSDRGMVSRVPGSAVQTYNYYGREFFDLPVALIESVQQLNPQTLEAETNVPFTLQVEEPGLRYSPHERNTLIINDPEAVFQPLRVTYLADPIIRRIDEYVTDPDTRIVNSNYMAKRMETISVRVEITVRSDLTVGNLVSLISDYISNLRSTERLGKDGIIKFLYQRNAVSFIDTDQTTLSARYFKFDGGIQVFNNVSEVFGADTAAYMPSSIIVNKLSPFNA